MEEPRRLQFSLLRIFVAMTCFAVVCYALTTVFSESGLEAGPAATFLASLEIDVAVCVAATAILGRHGFWIALGLIGLPMIWAWIVLAQRFLNPGVW